jgi:hypothetical protein
MWGKNLMTHSDAQEGKWRGNWRMEWVASTLHTTSEHGVSSITTADAHTSAASSRLIWRPHRFKWTRPFRRKTKSGFCACAITFQTQSACQQACAGSLCTFPLLCLYQFTLSAVTYLSILLLSAVLYLFVTSAAFSSFQCKCQQMRIVYCNGQQLCTCLLYNSRDLSVCLLYICLQRCTCFPTRISSYEPVPCQPPSQSLANRSDSTVMDWENT